MKVADEKTAVGVPDNTRVEAVNVTPVATPGEIEYVFVPVPPLAVGKVKLTAEFRAKRDNVLRQVVHTQPELVERAAERIQSYIIRERLLEHDSPIEAYQKGGMVKAEIDGILAAEFCQDLLAPVCQGTHRLKAGACAS